MCAPIGGRSGPVGAHPLLGALLERWLAQCNPHYTRSPDFTYSARGTYTGTTSFRFPELRRLGLQTSPKHLDPALRRMAMMSVLGIGVGAVFIAAVFMALIIDRRGARARPQYSSGGPPWRDKDPRTKNQKRRPPPGFST